MVLYNETICGSRRCDGCTVYSLR